VNTIETSKSLMRFGFPRPDDVSRSADGGELKLPFANLGRLPTRTERIAGSELGSKVTLFRPKKSTIGGREE
jgi:hypothetical protein